MPLFSHSHKPESSDAASDIDATGSRSTRGTIGALLRETRQSYGGDIAQIAGILRIRAAYLSAIEEGRYEGLPAPVYALGFVRAYANHLGLDGDEAVRRFKQETVDFESPRGLSFPVPLAERSIPGGTMLLAALILAFCGYGLWYYVSTGERARPERVSPVPAELAKALPQPQAPVAPPAPAVTPASAAPAALDASVTTGSPTNPPELAPTTAPIPPTATPATPSASTSVASSTPPTGTSFPPPGVTILPHPPAVPAPAATPTNPPVATATPATATPTPPPVSPTASQPHVYGAVDGPARIILHALKDDWVQIRDGDKVVTQRLLHQGDTLRVPDMPGLTMTAGDGAGLSIEVDGRNVPPLGAAVRHNVLLVPERLAAGTAVTDPAPAPRAPAPASVTAPASPAQ